MRRNQEKKLLIAVISIVCIIVFSIIFAIFNMNNSKIVKGVKISGIKVSGLTQEEAKNKIEEEYKNKKEKDITLKYNDFETTINNDVLGTKYDIDKAVNQAFNIGRKGNIISNNYNILFAFFGAKNLEIEMSIDEDETKKEIENIQTNLPDIVVEPDYYVENDKLIIIPGKAGIEIDEDKLISRIKDYLNDLKNNEEYIEIPVKNVQPEQIDIAKIHDEVCKQVQDAYITQNPTTVHPEVEGVEFNVDEAKKLLETNMERYEIQLTITKPNVTMIQLSGEAFPDTLAIYSTRYDGGDENRSINLKIACEKINDKVVLPGEIFSYNKTLGERTTSAGYKNAKVYENGAVVDGIGGGICQISSTLYNAVLRANLEIVERRNHQFVTSYVPEGLDATVAYGITDFKFKNTRKYAIKIKANASNGVATVELDGIKEDEEYQISFDTKTISTIPFTIKYENDNSLKEGEEVVKQQGANGVITETYIIKRLNGKIVSNDLLSRDTYNPMQRIILKGTKR